MLPPTAIGRCDAGRVPADFIKKQLQSHCINDRLMEIVLKHYLINQDSSMRSRLIFIPYLRNRG
jgi:hypothetical protein